MNEIITPGVQRKRLDVLRQECLAHAILNHPFLDSLRAGRLGRSEFQAWLSEQFFFSRQFPRCLAALFARIEDDRVAGPLVPFIATEGWGSAHPSAHWRLFETTLAAFGLTFGELRAARPHPATERYLAFRLDLCLTGSVAEGLGAIAYGHELVNEQIFAAYLKGLRALHDVSPDAQKYFVAHVEDEPEDFRVLVGVIEMFCKTDAELSSVERGARATLEARSRFFTAMADR